MSDTVGTCPSCHRAVRADQPLEHCLKCGQDLPAEIVARLPRVVPKEATSGPRRHASQDAPPLPPARPTPIRVVVTDIDIPIETMITLMLKAAVASIPAALILTVAVVFLGTLVGSCHPK
jgi:hypothetical protein